jgi:ribosomal RNA assembly protein
MQKIQIPMERAKKLADSEALMRSLRRVCHCQVAFEEENIVTIEGADAYEEYSAKNIVAAYGRGFDVNIAQRLMKEDYYFQIIDIRQLFSNKKRAREIKARLIGTDGRAKRYIEVVSSAKIAIYGDTVSIIGRPDEIAEAEAAIKSIINGTGHRKAYTRMEASHRKHTEERRTAGMVADRSG